MPRRVNAHRLIESVCFSLTNPRQFGIMLKWLFMLFAAVVMAFVAMRANAADLLVTVDGVRNASGEVRFALFDKPDEFPTGEKLQGQEEAAKEGKVQTVFKNLPPGAYAIAVHHDENSDNEMNLQLFVIPLEGYGFSNNARVIFAAPTFEAASFKVGGASLAISLKLVY